MQEVMVCLKNTKVVVTFIQLTHFLCTTLITLIITAGFKPVVRNIVTADLSHEPTLITFQK